MSDQALTPRCPGTFRGDALSTSTHDQIQIALALADEPILKTLLVRCIPSITLPHLLGSVTSKVAIPVPMQRAADGVIQYEAIHCTLAESQAQLEADLHISGGRDRKNREYARLTRFESETYTLGQGLTLAQAIALLSHSGFATSQVETILSLPYDGCYSSWWYSIDPNGNFTEPFRRTFRTLRYADGSFTLHYRDQFANSKPTCFQSTQEQVIVEIKSNQQRFSRTLEKINCTKEKLGISKALVICDAISELEAQAFISQGISIYSASEFILPLSANCSVCCVQDCPLQGNPKSPVMTCRRFCLDSESVDD